MVGILFQLSYHLGDVEKTLAGRLAVSNTTIENNAGVEAPLPSAQSIPVPLEGAAAHSRIQLTSGSTPCMLRDSFLVCLLFPVTRQLLNLTKLSKLALSCRDLSRSDRRRFSPSSTTSTSPASSTPVASSVTPSASTTAAVSSLNLW